MKNEIYISDIAAFFSDDNDIPECKGHPRTYEEIKKDYWDGPANCSSMHVTARQCHLFMLTEQGGIAGVGRMQIVRDKNLIRGRPGCIDIKAMAIAKSVPDGILITATYIDSSFMASPGNMPDEYQTTILLILKEESPGKLSITQDDSCLGNPNRIASIAAARKRLEQCAKASKGGFKGEVQQSHSQSQRLPAGRVLPKGN